MPFKNAYVLFDGIDGECTSKGHEKWIEILDFHHNIQMPAGTTLSGASNLSGGKADVSDFSVDVLLEKSAPLIGEWACSAGEIATIEVDLCETVAKTQNIYMKYKFTTCIICGCETKGVSENDAHSRPVLTVSFRSLVIGWKYTQVGSGGAVDAEIENAFDRSIDEPVSFP